MDKKKQLPVFPDLQVDLSLDIQSAAARDLYAYWCSKCGAGLPVWTDISLMDVYQLAPDIMVKEAVDGGREWRNRYFGSGLARNIGVDATNRLLAEYHDADNAAKALAFFNAIREERKPFRVAGRCIVIDREFKRLEGVYLPLEDRNGDVDMILCLEHYS